MDKHKGDVRKLASAMIDPEVKRNIILKPGGGSFLGGEIIRSKKTSNDQEPIQSDPIPCPQNQKRTKYKN